MESQVLRANSGWTETNGSNPSTLDPQLSAISYSRLSAPLVVTLSYMCVLFILSSIPGGRENVLLTSPTLANLLHVPAYGFLALLWIFTLRDHGITKHRSMCFAFLVASGYGGLMELNQILIPGRFPSVLDVMSNMVGSLLFIWLYWWMKLRRSFSLVEESVPFSVTREGD